jgi:mRNA interferase MazF
MNPGDVVLALLPTAIPTITKARPALVLSHLPGPYQTLLLCGISTRLKLVLVDWDEPILSTDADFAASGLHQPSVIRLSYLRSVIPADIQKSIGMIDPARLDRLRTRLSDRVRT